MDRAYSVLHVKSVEEGTRVIRGMATTPTADRVGDIVEPMGVAFKNPMPLLWQHKSDKPVGHVWFDKATKDGIPFKAQILDIPEAGVLKDRLDEAWQSVKYKLVAAVSIGFRALETAFLEKTGGTRFIKSEVFELSLVTIPANAEATITSIKSIDTGVRAALGIRDTGTARFVPPGASGSTTKLHPNRQEAKMNTSEKIAALETQRTETIKSWEAIKNLDTKTAEQKASIKQFMVEIEALDEEIEEEKAFERAIVGTAKAVNGNGAGAISTAYRAPAAVAKKEEPGIRFTRVLKAKAVSRLEGLNVDTVAAGMYGKDSETYHLVTKVNEVVPGTTVTGNWGYDLIAQEGGALAEYNEFLREGTIIGKFGTNGIPALRSVEFYRAIVSQTEEGDGYWVAEGKPKPLTAFAFQRDVLLPLKMANISVLTDENIRYSTPKSDMIIRDQLSKALIKVEDLAFIDPSNGGTPGQKPVSITSGAPAIASTGPDIDDIILDVRSLMAKYTDANNDLMSGVFVMSPNNANALGTVVNALGQVQFPSMNMRGGSLFGFPVIVSKHAGTNVVLLNANDVFVATEGGIQVDVSRETSLEMKDASLSQDGAAGTGASLVSMFQNNMVAFRAEKTINWMRAPERTAVAYLTSVIWGGAVVAS